MKYNPALHIYQPATADLGGLPQPPTFVSRGTDNPVNDLPVGDPDPIPRVPFSQHCQRQPVLQPVHHASSSMDTADLPASLVEYLQTQ